mmetsp:Transcript_6931/g.42322  ORF Transcript_6931/g.42322 Transcript_6931/m.42322 type:complete len:251 (+) Transcript_6931:1938-2690(+)
MCCSLFRYQCGKHKDVSMQCIGRFQEDTADARFSTLSLAPLTFKIVSAPISSLAHQAFGNCAQCCIGSGPASSLGRHQYVFLRFDRSVAARASRTSPRRCLTCTFAFLLISLIIQSMQRSFTVACTSVVLKHWKLVWWVVQWMPRRSVSMTSNLFHFKASQSSLWITIAWPGVGTNAPVIERLRSFIAQKQSSTDPRRECSSNARTRRLGMGKTCALPSRTRISSSVHAFLLAQSRAMRTRTLPRVTACS